MHGAATHDRMTSSSTSVGVGPSPLDGMIADSINAKAARTSFSGFGHLIRAQLQWGRRAVRGNATVLLALIRICMRIMFMSATELTGFDRRVPILLSRRSYSSRYSVLYKGQLLLPEKQWMLVPGGARALRVTPYYKGQLLPPEKQWMLVPGNCSWHRPVSL